MCSFDGKISKKGIMKQNESRLKRVFRDNKKKTFTMAVIDVVANHELFKSNNHHKNHFNIWIHVKCVNLPY